MFKKERSKECNSFFERKRELAHFFNRLTVRMDAIIDYPRKIVALQKMHNICNFELSFFN